MNMTYWGYWTYDKGDVFRPFSPGVYTIEGEDYWGQATFLHFRVVENQSPLNCATIATNSSFVGYTNGSAGPGPLKLDAYYQESGNRTARSCLRSPTRETPRSPAHLIRTSSFSLPT